MPAFSCSRMHFEIVASFSPTVDTQCPSAQNLLLPNSCYMLACRPNTIGALSPFRKPMTLEAPCSGEYASSMRKVGHKPLDGLYPLVLAEPPEYLPKVLPDLVEDGFPLSFGASTMRRPHIRFACERPWAFRTIRHRHPLYSDSLRPEQSQASDGRMGL